MSLEIQEKKKTFELTDEQKAIIATNENIVVAALAGSGKTSTLVEYVKTRPDKCSVLYLAFNKSVKQEAERKFMDVNNCFIEVKTAHSLAYHAIVIPNKYKAGFLNAEDIMQRYKITDYVLATHVLKLITAYSISKFEKVEDVDYIATLTTDKAIIYACEYADEILRLALLVIKGLKMGSLTMPHDFYLKLYQLSKPKLDYDYILFDEGQDASETMLDIFLSQEKPIKVIVGDNHQQIYSWRGAVNSLQKVDYKRFTLSQSFRFTQEIADMAIKAVKWKKIVGDNQRDFKLIGSGKPNKDGKRIKGVIARTNIKLIDYVVRNVILEKTIKKVYFEGGFQSYSINNVHAYINDILALSNGQPHRIKNKRLMHLKNVKELEEFIEETEDVTLSQAVQMVTVYGKRLPEYLEKIKLAETMYKDDCDVVVTSCHKAKGCEYDEVTLLDDFSDLEKLENILDKSKANFEEMDKVRVNEEINILYVAITRAKDKIRLPDNIRKSVT